jgi:hypothetical protein
MTPATRLLRQLHPNFFPRGELSSQAFFPFPKDAGKLSVYDGDKIEPRDAHSHYTQTLGNESVGVWGVTCEEVVAVGLAAIPDPLVNFAAHALIDFANQDEKEYRKLAKKLKAAAVERGCLFST